MGSIKSSGTQRNLAGEKKGLSADGGPDPPAATAGRHTT